MEGAAGVRDQRVDALKTIAIIDVLLIHVAAPICSGGIGTGSWLWGLFWGSVSRCGVPLFLMCSGALLLPPERPLPLKKLYTKNLPRLLLALLFWAMCYKLFALWISGALTADALAHAVKEVLLFKHEQHLYYLHIMLLVYAFLPVTRVLTAHMDRRQMRYFLLLWFLLGILYPTVRSLWPFTLLTGIPVQWRMNMTYASIGYTVLGYYLARYPIRSRLGSGLTALVGFGMVFGGTWVGSITNGSLYERFLEGMTVGVCLLGAGVYSLFQHITLPEWAARAAGFVSRASFCVFLTHIFFLKGFASLGVAAVKGPVAASIPLMAALLLLCGCAVYGVLSRIPGARKWLV